MKHRICSCFIFLLVFLISHFALAFPAKLGPVVDQIYNADFSQARTNVNAYIHDNPEEPAGYLLRGILNEWDQVVNNKRGGNNRIIQEDYEKANMLAEAALASDENNVDKMVMLGNTDMYIAKKLVDSGNKMRGGFALRKAKDLMLQAIALDPNNYDAYMALGVFNYFSENVPSGFKWLASLLGFNGNKTTGLNYLKHAAENKNLTQGDAGFLVVYIYERKEKDYDTALKYNAILKARYPNNPTFQYDDGELYFHKKDYDGSRRAYAQFENFCASKAASFCNNKYLFLMHYYKTWGYLDQEKYADAKKEYDLAVKLNDGQYAERNAQLDLWGLQFAKKKGDTELANVFLKKIAENKKSNPAAWRQAQIELGIDPDKEKHRD